MNRSEITVMRQVLRAQLKRYDDINTACRTCEHYAVRECKKFKAPPPDDWIKSTNPCEHWQWDYIPF